MVISHRKSGPGATLTRVRSSGVKWIRSMDAPWEGGPGDRTRGPFGCTRLRPGGLPTVREHRRGTEDHLPLAAPAENRPLPVTGTGYAGLRAEAVQRTGSRTRPPRPSGVPDTRSAA
ncbi:hypothetical protein GCM10010284_28330 [Streptomyces rubiginosohelvolus]|uniref:Uncharacterized protein n=1 Tax=Streptomyces rubiginosohelvolus TaxID=67362 RepID=A0ABQ3C8L9_9ACTN|nr:hypothetical protein GCM10010284_28330 [Streptomyces rubiginosohelvolus]GGZ68352.1 hypothetical protein GCM10010328_49440 [Streptomyces pluricolorescens]